MPPARVVEIARAKINLALHVLGRRSDGYHELDSIVAFTELGDRLSFEPSAETALEIAGPFAGDVPKGPDNIVLRAATYLGGLMPGHIIAAQITLEKNLPVAAGLGGGSADAAAALRGLARLSDVTIADQDNETLARTLGADVPVCLLSRTCRMSGIGEQLAPLPGLAGQPVLLVNPGVPVATAHVFDALGFRYGDKGFDPISDPADLGDLRNDLTAPACRVCPAIAEVLSAIGSVEGVRYARMSGSGATCFGVFSSTDEARRAARAIRADHPSWWCAVTTFA